MQNAQNSIYLSIEHGIGLLFTKLVDWQGFLNKIEFLMNEL